MEANEATHILKCKHCIGRSCKNYTMPCIVLSTTVSGMIKILVFGERDWKDKKHIKRIRYVYPSRVALINNKQKQ